MSAMHRQHLSTWLRVVVIFASVSLAVVALSTSEGWAQADAPAATTSDGQAAPAKSAADTGKSSVAYDAAKDGESVSGLHLMVAAYIAIWLGLFFYFLTLLGRQRKLRVALDELRARIHTLDDRVQERQ